MSTLWVHKVDIYKTVYLLDKFHRSEGLTPYFIGGIGSGGCFPENVNGIPKATLAP